MASTREALQQAFSKPIVRRSLIVAVVVGTALNAINQGPEIWNGEPVNAVKLGLTYIVPFLVASFGAYSALRS